MVKKYIKEVVNSFGYEIKKKSTRFNGEKEYLKWYSQDSLNSKNFYNFGAGGFKHRFWTNVDYFSDWYKKYEKNISSGIHYDMLSLKPIKIKDFSAEIVYSSHVIEHLTDEAVQFFFKESYRILKKGGIIRITAPDVDLHYNAMLNNDKEFYYWKDWYATKDRYESIMLNQPLDKASIYQLFLERIAGSTSILHADGAKKRINDDELKSIFKSKNYEDALNFICSQCPIDIQKKYPGNHINWWNKNKTRKFLKNAGFSKIYDSGYAQSIQPVLRDEDYFDNTHPPCSFYIEAVK